MCSLVHVFVYRNLSLYSICLPLHSYFFLCILLFSCIHMQFPEFLCFVAYTCFHWHSDMFPHVFPCICMSSLVIPRVSIFLSFHLFPYICIFLPAFPCEFWDMYSLFSPGLIYGAKCSQNSDSKSIFQAFLICWEFLRALLHV